MNRWLLRICVFLLLGAIVNVAVAWGLANWTFPRYFSDILWLDLGGDRLCAGYVGSGLGSGSIHWAQDYSRSYIESLPNPLPLKTTIAPPAWSRFHDCESPLSGEISAYIEEGRGWPMISLSYGTSFANDSSLKQIRRPLVVDGIAMGVRPPRQVRYGPVPKALPLQPIWPGFAINTVFYAALFWLLFAAPFALRRRRRIRRGLCPKCAYPVGDSPVCTECGAAVTRLRPSE